MENRKKFFFCWHLGISACVVLSFIACAILVWSPWPLPLATGLGRVILTLFFVDVVLGPCMFLFFYKPGRKYALLDLLFIFAVQIVAFGYGSWAVFSGRPAYFVFVIDRFQITTASEIQDTELKKVTDPSFASIPLFGPHIALAQMPTDISEKNRILFSALNGADINVFPQYFVKYGNDRAGVLSKAKTAQQIQALNPGVDVAAQVLKVGRAPESVRFLPLAARQMDMTVMVDAKTAEIYPHSESTTLVVIVLLFCCARQLMKSRMFGVL